MQVQTCRILWAMCTFNDGIKWNATDESLLLPRQHRSYTIMFWLFVPCTARGFHSQDEYKYSTLQGWYLYTYFPNSADGKRPKEYHTAELLTLRSGETLQHLYFKCVTHFLQKFLRCCINWRSPTFVHSENFDYSNPHRKVPVHSSNVLKQTGFFSEWEFGYLFVKK